MHIAILGAGVIGVSSAYFLQQHGCQVTLIDRAAQPASATSFANGGQISVCHAQPWANPSTLRHLPELWLQPDAPLRIRPQRDPQFWRWLLAFLGQCRSDATRHNIAQLIALGLYSRRSLQQLRTQLGLQYAHSMRGILHFYTQPAALKAAQVTAAYMRSLGCERRAVSVEEALAIEPALTSQRDVLVGGTYTADDESGDACAFTRALAQQVAAAGASLRMNTHIQRLHSDGQRITAVELVDQHGALSTLRADAYVIALGCASAAIARAVGVPLLIVPAKGYSLTLPVKDPAYAYQTALTDDEHKLVFSRLGARLRIAGMAELRGFDLGLDPARCAQLLNRVRTLFPNAADLSRPQFWCGLRPVTPSSLPYIGATRYPNLYLNTGHGTLGWTLACGAGRALADLIQGHPPEPAFPFLLRP